MIHRLIDMVHLNVRASQNQAFTIIQTIIVNVKYPSDYFISSFGIGKDTEKPLATGLIYGVPTDSLWISIPLYKVIRGKLVESLRAKK